ncbi:site-specific integrase [Gracilibacillus sp. YIM 98692]|uniref:tyrosine-type recombinase/integrase n=1 Tax=Gracilibacillus sp. YIM 98692 TaxID=2663532 RepID=UPI0013D06BE3|nr:site-specific integrase [Gracilibacillus sp. YIM 98692]
MPYGFSTYLRRNDRSEETIDYYNQIIHQFFSYVDKHSKAELEIYEIGTKYIYGFLNQKKERCSNATVNKIISILKHFFDYLWRYKYIPIDPMAKVRREKNEINPNALEYMNLLEAKPLILSDHELKLSIKAIYVLMLKGITVSEMLFHKKDVFVINEEYILINVVGKLKTQRRTVELKGKDAQIFYLYYEQSLFHSTPYVFYRRRLVGDTEYGQIHHNNVNNAMKKIRQKYPSLDGLTLTAARTSYILYLYKTRQYTVEQLAYLFGTNKTNISNLIESNLVKVKKELETDIGKVVE